MRKYCSLFLKALHNPNCRCMRISICLSSFISLLFLVSCAQRNAGDCSFDLSQEKSSLELYDYVAQADVIGLETSDACLIRSIDKIKSFKGDYLILDKQARRILRFNENGTFVSKIDRVGRGPGEYMYISDFDVVDDKVYLLDMDRIIVYDDEGNPMSTIMVDLDCDMFALKVLPDERFLIAAADPSRKLIHLIDHNGSLINQALTCTASQLEALIMRDDAWSFLSSEGGTYVSVPLMESLYRLNGEEVESLDIFRTSASPASFIEQNAKTVDPEAFFERLDTDYFNPGKKTVTPCFYSCTGTIDGRPFILFNDRKTGSKSVFGVKDSIIAMLLFGDHSHQISDDVLVSDMSPLNRSTIEKMLTLPSRNETERKILEDIASVDLSSDNPILVRIQLRCPTR